MTNDQAQGAWRIAAEMRVVSSRHFCNTLTIANNKKNEMVLTIISIWAGAIAIGVYGAAAALSNRWARALVVIVVAGVSTISLLRSLQGELAIALFDAGEAFVWLTMLSPVVMWLLLAAGTSIAIWKQRARELIAG